MDTSIDRRGSSHNPKQAWNIVQNIIEECQLCDIWRIRNPEKSVFSWMKTRPNIMASRIDFALVSQGLSSAITNTMYLPGIMSDHLAFYMVVDVLQNERGRGYWKFNTKYLHDKDFLQMINASLEIEVPNSDQLEEYERWQYLQNIIVKKSKDYAKNSTQDRNIIISQLSEKVNELQYKVSDQKLTNQQTLKILQNSIDELEGLLEDKAKETIFRTKSNWYELGEKSNKFFLNMEKRNYNARTCSKLLVEGKEITEQEKILDEQYKFYKDLYTTDASVKFTLKNESDIKVDENIRKKDEDDIHI